MKDRGLDFLWVAGDAVFFFFFFFFCFVLYCSCCCWFVFLYFLAHLSRRLKVSFCDHSPSVVVVVRPSVRSQSLNNISS